MSPTTTLKTRKPVDQLLPDDFDAFPIWEYSTDEEHAEERDETWVRPVRSQRVRLGEYSQIVAAKFVTRAKTPLVGFMVVTTAKEDIEVSPGAVVDRGFYSVLPSVSRREAETKKYSWAVKARDRIIDRLGVDEDDVFPISYELTALIGPETTFRHGEIV